MSKLVKLVLALTTMATAFIFIFIGNAEAKSLTVSGLDKSGVLKAKPSSVSEGFDYYTIKGKANKNQTVYLLADEDGNDPKNYQVWDKVKADKKGNFSFETSSANNSKAVYYVSTDKKLKNKESDDIFNVKKIKQKVKVILPANTQNKEEASESSEKSDEIDVSRYEDMNYTEFLRNPKQYEKKMVKFTGVVAQYDDANSRMLVAFNGDPDQLVYVGLAKSVNTDQRFLDGDNVTLYGSFRGVNPYSTNDGRDNYVPWVYAIKIDNQGQ
ncbi:hypothetical protein [uncultured Ligilactobacillus sp.]|uniref:hypothetical protein n=1 Tax=uncultured Ligilactobacillus sp. TaxID=2837633 RepID=UPI0027299787|nr:hypothetical protein [uncultured Ligilactobacillus sp.]